MQGIKYLMLFLSLFASLRVEAMGIEHSKFIAFICTNLVQSIENNKLIEYSINDQIRLWINGKAKSYIVNKDVGVIEFANAFQAFLTKCSQYNFSDLKDFYMSFFDIVINRILPLVERTIILKEMKECMELSSPIYKNRDLSNLCELKQKYASDIIPKNEITKLTDCEISIRILRLGSLMSQIKLKLY